jgi:tripartite-type tricarboxylate transporter receptor subunit TctC
LPQLIAFARANPGKVTYGSSGTGTTTLMVGALFALRAGVEMVHVPYRGAGQMIGGFLAGDLDLMIGEASTVLPHVREGRAIAIAQTGAQRSPVLPNAPTLEEAIPGTAMPIWFALCGSRATPPEAAARLVQEMAPLRDGSDLAQRMAANGAKLILSEPQVLRQRLEREVPLWRQVVQQAGIKAE